MMDIYLVNLDFSPLDATRLEELFRSDERFCNVKDNLVVGELLEADYVSGDDVARVALDEQGTALSISWESDVSVSIALLLRNGLGQRLRVFDTQYSFDLVIDESTTLEELMAAIDATQSRGEG
jgi:hypothetical protein